jgi:TusA-related sulfurtransferase
MIQRLQKRGYIEGGYTVRKRLGRLYLTRDLAVRSEKLPPMFGEKLLRWIAKTETLQEGEMIEIKEAPSAARHAIKRLSELNQLTEGYVVRVRKLRTNQPEVYLVRLSADPETREIQLDLIGRNVKKTKNKA